MTKRRILITKRRILMGLAAFEVTLASLDLWLIWREHHA